MFQVTLLLADSAQVAEGKLYILGGAWTLTGPGPVPAAIAAVIHVPWDQANADHTWRLELVDADGNPVIATTADGEEQPVSMEDGFKVGRPAEAKPGSRIDYPIAINLPTGHPTAPGGRYEWRMWINGDTRDEWRLPFGTRPAQDLPEQA